MTSIGELLARSRRMSGLTQEAAAEAVGGSVRTVQRYEVGDTAVPYDTIWLFARAYNDPGLIYRVMQQTPLLAAVMPAPTEASLPTSAINVMAKLNLLEDLSLNMVNVLQDGRISPDEREKWEEIQEAIKHLGAACIQALEAVRRQEP